MAAFLNTTAEHYVEATQDLWPSGGVVITDEVVERLAAEAEAGYEVDALGPRGGRKPMGSGPATRNSPLALRESKIWMRRFRQTSTAAWTFRGRRRSSRAGRSCTGFEAVLRQAALRSPTSSSEPTPGLRECACLRGMLGPIDCTSRGSRSSAQATSERTQSLKRGRQ